MSRLDHLVPPLDDDRICFIREDRFVRKVAAKRKRTLQAEVHLLIARVPAIERGALLEEVRAEEGP